MVRARRARKSAKYEVSEGYDNWLKPKEAEAQLLKLCGVWTDKKGSAYTVSQGPYNDELDVMTERPNGEVQHSAGLIHIQWQTGQGRIVWGRSGPHWQYVMAWFDGNSLQWECYGTPAFEWKRQREPHVWVPKNPVLKEWMSQSRLEALLIQLSGVWTDKTGSSYTLSRSQRSQKLDVVTKRRSGAVRKTTGLIHIVWKGEQGQVVWGPKNGYTLSSFDGKTLEWQGKGSSRFKWSRLNEEEPDSTDVEEVGTTTKDTMSDETGHEPSSTLPEEHDDEEEYEEEEEECEEQEEPEERGRAIGGRGDEVHLHRARLRREFETERRQAYLQEPVAGERTEGVPAVENAESREHESASSTEGVSAVENAEGHEHDNVSSTEPRSEADDAAENPPTPEALPEDDDRYVNIIKTPRDDDEAGTPSVEAAPWSVATPPHDDDGDTPAVEALPWSATAEALPHVEARCDDDGSPQVAGKLEAAEQLPEAPKVSTTCPIEEPSQVEGELDPTERLLAALKVDPGSEHSRKGAVPGGICKMADNGPTGGVQNSACAVQYAQGYVGTHVPTELVAGCTYGMFAPANFSCGPSSCVPAWQSMQMPPQTPQTPLIPTNNFGQSVDLKQVVAQVEYWFSDENLARDAYLRELMNDEGWVSLSFLQHFRRMQQMGAEIWALRCALISSQVLELDGTALFVRLRDKERRARWLSRPVQGCVSRQPL